LGNLIFRFFDQSKLIKYFPLDFVNDISSYMAQLFFLAKCGFYKFCPYWYNGFITFKYSPPGWYFFSLPFYYLFNGNVLIATYVSFTLLFVFGFFIIYFFGKIHKLSRISRLAFFIFFFGNAIAVGNFIRLGRYHELLGWVLFLILGFVVLYYKDRKLDFKSISIPILFSLIILTHSVIMILSSVLLFSLFLIKGNKEKLLLVFYGFLGLLATSFWLLPNLLDLQGGWFLKHKLTVNLINFKELLGENIASFVVPIILLGVFYFYYKSKNKSKRELLFYAPILFLSVLFMSRLVIFLPILDFVYPDAYMMFFLFFILFLFFKTKYEKRIYKLILVLLIIISLVSVGYNMYFTPKFSEYTDLEKETLDALEKVEGTFMIFSKQETSYNRAYYSYAPIFLDLRTPGGWYPFLSNKEYIEDLRKLHGFVDKKDCGNFKEYVELFNVDEIISYYDSCAFLKECGFKEKVMGKVCLFEK